MLYNPQVFWRDRINHEQPIQPVVGISLDNLIKDSLDDVCFEPQDKIHWMEDELDIIHLTEIDNNESLDSIYYHEYGSKNMVYMLPYIR